jgi:hypothetical protein
MCGGHIGIDDRDRIFVLCVKFIFKLGQFELVAGLELELGCFFSHVEATISCNPFVFCSGQLKGTLGTMFVLLWMEFMFV